jgi:hypothetical protein
MLTCHLWAQSSSSKRSSILILIGHRFFMHIHVNWKTLRICSNELNGSVTEWKPMGSDDEHTDNVLTADYSVYLIKDWLQMWPVNGRCLLLPGTIFVNQGWRYVVFLLHVSPHLASEDGQVPDSTPGISETTCLPISPICIFSRNLFSSAWVWKTMVDIAFVLRFWGWELFAPMSTS